MNKYKIIFDASGPYVHPPETIIAKKVVLDETGQKIFYGKNGDDIVCIASAETTVIKMDEINN